MKSYNKDLWNQIKVENMETRDEYGCWCETFGCVDWCFSCVCVDVRCVNL